MSIPLNDNLDVRSPKATDQRYGKFASGVWKPFDTVSEALATITSYRHEGLLVPIRRSTNKIDLYWFEGGITNSHLVLYKPDVVLSNYYTKAEVDAIISALPPANQNLEEVTTGSNNNVTSNTLQVTDVNQLVTNIRSTVLYNYGSAVNAGGIGVTDGLSNFRRIVEYSETAETTNLYNDLYSQSLVLREQTSSDAGAILSSRLELLPAINLNEAITLGQTNNLLDDYQLLSEKGQANGYVGLTTVGANTRIPFFDNTGNLTNSSTFTYNSGTNTLLACNDGVMFSQTSSSLSGAVGIGNNGNLTITNNGSGPFILLRGNGNQNQMRIQSSLIENLQYSKSIGFSADGILLPETPGSASGTYTILTRNASTGAITQVASSAIIGTLQSVTTGTNNNATTNAVHITGQTGFDLTKTGLGLYSPSTGVSRISNIQSGAVNAQISLQAETSGTPGVIISNRLGIQEALNGDEATTLDQVTNLIATTTVPDATSSIKGKIKLAGDLGGTADVPTVPALASKAPLDSPTFTGTVNGITPIMVGLGNVNNTSDANKPVSIAQQAALDLKADLSVVQLKSEKNQPNGYPGLDGGGKILASQLPNTIMELQGSWNASTNTPTLTDGTGNPGDVYQVSVAGTQNLGSGSITFAVNDFVVYGASGIWFKSENSNAVTSVFGRVGTITAQSGDYISFYVPYTGATGNVNLGVHSLLFQNIDPGNGTYNNTISPSEINLTYTPEGGANSAQAALSAEAGLYIKTRTDIATGQALLRSDLLTVNRNFQFPNADGTLALTSNLTAYVPYTGATTNVNLGANNITSNSFIKSGGTSSQFLKADGSVDGNTYTPTNGTGATGTWGINISGNAATATNSTQWSSQTYTPVQSGTIQLMMAHDGTGWKYTEAPALRTFLGSPSGGETLPSVMARDRYITNNSYITYQSDGDDVVDFQNAAGTRQGYMGKLSGGYMGIHNAVSVKTLRLNNAGDMAYDGSASFSGAVGADGGFSTGVSGLTSVFTYGGGSALIGTNTSHPLKLRTGGTDYVTLLTNGNFGIGTTSPAYKLSVVGDIGTSGHIIADGDITSAGIVEGETLNATGDVFSAGTVQGAGIVSTGAVAWGTSSYAAGVSKIYNTASEGTTFVPKTGSSTDFRLVNGVGGDVLSIPTGTGNVNVVGNVTTTGANSGFNIGSGANSATIRSNSALGMTFNSLGPDNSTQGKYTFVVSRADNTLNSTVLTLTNSLATFATGLNATGNSNITGNLAVTDNVGVGTVSPSAKLDVNGEAIIGDPAAANNGRFRIIPGYQGVTLSCERYAGAWTDGDVTVQARSITLAADVSITGNVTAANLTSGTYTPTVTGVSNFTSASSIQTAHYTRVGDEVTVIGSFTATPTNPLSAITYTVSLPISSDFVLLADCSGFAILASPSGTYSMPKIDANTISNEAEFNYLPGGGSNEVRYMFKYTIK